MSAAVEDIVDQAIAWHLRLADASAEEWHAFVDWLETSDAHRDAYDRITLDDALLSPRLELNPLPKAANDAGPLRRFYRWTAAGGGAVAAALLAFAVVPQESVPDFYTVETAPGQLRTVVLEEGTSIEMNGGTTLTLRRDDPRYAALDAGEATFHVRHDASRPFELKSGSAVIRDLGTVFNVAREKQHLDVQVAEGAVMYEPDRASVKLTPGMALTVDEAKRRAVVETIPAESVGGWRRGAVSFHNATIRAVASAIERSTGATVRVDPSLAERAFTGTVHLTGAREKVIPRIAGLMDAGWRRDGGDWVLFVKGDEGR